MSNSVVSISGLSRRYGRALALKEIDFAIAPGMVYGLVGANGAGKTTLIKHILGLLRPQTGRVRVFDQDPITNPVEVLQQIGYLSEARELPEWMRIDELMRYTSAFYPDWDRDYCDELIELFGLDPTKKINELSKGMRAQVGLIAAVSPRPALLLLDEPSTGLDAIVRRDILNAIVRTVAEAGRTVLFSSHLLDEVEQMSDHVFMIDHGQWVLQGCLDEIKERHHHMIVELESPTPNFPGLEAVLSAESTTPVAAESTHWRLICSGDRTEIENKIRTIGGSVSSTRGVSLDEIFVARVGRERISARETVA